MLLCFLVHPFLSSERKCSCRIWVSLNGNKCVMWPKIIFTSWSMKLFIPSTNYQNFRHILGNPHMKCNHGGWQWLRYACIKLTPTLKQQPYFISKVSTSEYNGVVSKQMIKTSNHVCHKVQNSITLAHHTG